MLKPRWFLSVLLLAIAAMVFVPTLIADPVKKATEVTFGQPVEIPGMVLLPGDYVIKVPDPMTHSDMVGFYNRDESYLYKLVRAIPAYRLDPTDKVILTFEERPGNTPQAIKTWFIPGERWGKEFVYGKALPVTVAEETPFAETPTVPVLAPEPAPAVEEETAEIAAEPVAPVEIAEAAPAPAPEPIPIPPAEELPKTATELPLVGLAGAFALGLGALLKWKA